MEREYFDRVFQVLQCAYSVLRKTEDSANALVRSSGTAKMISCRAVELETLADVASSLGKESAAVSNGARILQGTADSLRDASRITDHGELALHLKDSCASSRSALMETAQQALKEYADVNALSADDIFQDDPDLRTALAGEYALADRLSETPNIPTL